MTGSVGSAELRLALPSRMRRTVVAARTGWRYHPSEERLEHTSHAPFGVTMSRQHTYSGSCHCGNLALRLASDRTPRELGVRADDCSFCARHHARFTSDPLGEVSIAIRDSNRVARYRFGTKTADFIVCRACGVFIAAMMAEPALAVVNVNALDARNEFLVGELVIASFDGEAVEQRLARRKARWTPVVSFVEGSERDAPP
jgi:hypothetical protein